MDLVSAICLHYTVLGSLAELEQLRRGLHVQKFSTLLDDYPKLLRGVFIQESKLTSHNIHDLFVVNFSPKGSIKKILKKL